MRRDCAAKPQPEMVAKLPEETHCLDYLLEQVRQAGAMGEACVWLGKVTWLREKTVFMNSVRRWRRGIRTASELKKHA